MKFSNFEKETIILFNEQDGTARIETFNPRLLKQLRNVTRCDGVSCEETKKGYGVYNIPKTMIKIHAPCKSSMSDEQRQKTSERMKAYHANRKKALLSVSNITLALGLASTKQVQGETYHPHPVIFQKLIRRLEK